MMGWHLFRKGTWESPRLLPVVVENSLSGLTQNVMKTAEGIRDDYKETMEGLNDEVCRDHGVTFTRRDVSAERDS